MQGTRDELSLIIQDPTFGQGRQALLLIQYQPGTDADFGIIMHAIPFLAAKNGRMLIGEQGSSSLDFTCPRLGRTSQVKKSRSKHRQGLLA